MHLFFNSGIVRVLKLEGKKKRTSERKKKNEMMKIMGVFRWLRFLHFDLFTDESIALSASAFFFLEVEERW